MCSVILVDNNELDQATRERQVRQLLTSAKTEETLAYDDRDGAKARMERADALRNEAQELGRPLPDDVMNRLLKEYASGGVG
jgi:hypothetical protein